MTKLLAQIARLRRAACRTIARWSPIAFLVLLTAVPPRADAGSPSRDIPVTAAAFTTIENQVVQSTLQNLVGEDIGDPSWDATKIINTDRPDFTDVLPTVGDGVWQLESGYTYKRHREPGARYDRHQLPESLIRVGLTPRFELRFRWDGYVLPHAQATPDSSHENVWGTDTTVGFKWVAFEQKKWLPQHTLMGTVAYKYSSPELPVAGWVPGANWVYGWQVAKWLVVRGSTGVEYLHPREPENGPFLGFQHHSTRATAELHQSAVAYWQISKRLGAYTEWFSFYDVGSVDDNQQNLGIGAYIYLTPNIQLDLRYGDSIGSDVRDRFIGFGFSTRGFFRQPRRH